MAREEAEEAAKEEAKDAKNWRHERYAALAAFHNFDVGRDKFVDAEDLCLRVNRSLGAFDTPLSQEEAERMMVR